MASTIPLERRVVITGLGVVSCCGLGKDAFLVFGAQWDFGH